MKVEIEMGAEKNRKKCLRFCHVLRLVQFMTWGQSSSQSGLVGDVDVQLIGLIEQV